MQKTRSAAHSGRRNLAASGPLRQRGIVFLQSSSLAFSNCLLFLKSNQFHNIFSRIQKSFPTDFTQARKRACHTAHGCSAPKESHACRNYGSAMKSGISGSGSENSPARPKISHGATIRRWLAAAAGAMRLAFLAAAWEADDACACTGALLDTPSSLWLSMGAQCSEGGV